MTLGYVVWDVNPVAIDLGVLQIRWYGILFALGFIVGYYLMQHFFRKENIPLPELESLTLATVLGAVLGARLGHVLFYDAAYYMKHPAEILYFWQGGLASHGGAIGIIIAIFLHSQKKQHQSMLWTLDRLVIPTALAGSFIRIGNLMNSEIYGEPTNLPWGFVFIRDGNFLPHHPTQIYESLAYLCIFLLLLTTYFRRKGLIPGGLLLGWFLTLVFGFRFCIEFIKLPQVGFENELPLNMGQFLSLLFIIPGIVLLINSYSKAKSRKQKDFPKV